MKIIPKEEITRQNAIRYAVVVAKNAFVDVVLEAQTALAKEEFAGTWAEIEAVADANLKVKLADARTECVKAAETAGCAETWDADILRLAKAKKENKAKKGNE